MPTACRSGCGHRSGVIELRAKRRDMRRGRGRAPCVKLFIDEDKEFLGEGGEEVVAAGIEGSDGPLVLVGRIMRIWRLRYHCAEMVFGQALIGPSTAMKTGQRWFKIQRRLDYFLTEIAGVDI